MKRTKCQLTIEGLGRLIDCACKQSEALKGFDDPLSKEMDQIAQQLSARQVKLKIKEKYSIYSQLQTT